MRIRIPLARIVFSSLSFFALAACSGDSSSLPLMCDIPGCTLISEPTLDGMVLNNGDVITDGSFQFPFVGDVDSLMQGLAGRQFYSFNIASIAPHATVTIATLRLWQYAVSLSGQPYLKLGNVIVDHVTYDTTLVSGAYNGATIAANIGTLSTNDTVGYKELDVTSSVLNDIANGRASSQFRLRFSGADSNSDGIDDYVVFTDGEIACCLPAQAPQLVLTLN